MLSVFRYIHGLCQKRILCLCVLVDCQDYVTVMLWIMKLNLGVLFQEKII